MSAEYQVHGSVAVITLNNPPVNGMGLATRTAAVNGIKQAWADDAVKAIVITGAGKAFSGGADIKEFNTPAALAEPNLHTLIATAEGSTKPVVAAIHTVCMGGGLELALGCHYRVAMPGAQIALPEVKLGLLPGAGGTQRLPRVLGLEMALNMIVSGTPVASEKLAKTALFDELFAADADLLTSAIAFAEKIADARPLPRVRDRKVDYPNHEAFLQFSRNTVKAMSGPFPAPLECVETVAASVTMKFEDGMKFERERFIHLIQTTESKALRHAFFAERQASKVPDVPADTPVRAIKSAAVIGAGTMGGGIAMNFLNAGIPVVMLETKQEALDKGIATIRKNYDNTMKKGKLTQEKFDQRMALLSGTHFFSPANVMKLLEIVRGAKTGKDVLATTLALSKKLKKTGVVSGVCDGFIGNRMIEQYSRQAGFLLEEGCLPEQVDKAVEKFGFAMGPFRMGDLAGNDIGWYIRKRRYVESPEISYSKTADLLCEMGRFGQKTGAGWYDYKAGDRKAYANEQVNAMIVQHSADLGVTRRKIGDQEIVERLVYAMVNEAALILEEGIAMRASDIDMVYLTGYGFPLFRGGPMFYADTVGLPNVLTAIEKYARGHHGEAWKPAPLLLKLVAEGKTFTG